MCDSTKRQHCLTMALVSAAKGYHCQQRKNDTRLSSVAVVKCEMEVMMVLGMTIASAATIRVANPRLVGSQHGLRLSTDQRQSIPAS